MIAVVLGGLLGFLVFLASSALVTFKLLISPRLLPKLPELILPEQIEFELDENAPPIEAESAEWLNALVNWLAVNFIEIPRVQEFIKLRIAEGIVDIRRTPLGCVLVNSELLDVNFGTSTPTIGNIHRLDHSVSP